MFESVIIFLKLLHALKDVEANDLTELYKHTSLTVIASSTFLKVLWLLKPVFSQDL